MHVILFEKRGTKVQHYHDATACFSSLLLGTLVGAAVTLLAAPRSGPETRSLVGKKPRESADQARAMASRSREQGQEAAEYAHERAQAATEYAGRAAKQASR